MGLLGKKQKKLYDDNSQTPSDASVTVADSETDLLQDVMLDNLDLMREIVMKVREDEKFAKSIYADCPRLQHLLDQHPDLRPVFEDPNLVRINFEQVYRNAGGELPEDKPNKFKKTLACIVKHPLFKVFRFLLLLKKCYNCVVGGGIMMVKNCFCSMCFNPPAPDDLIDDDDDDGLEDTPGSLENQAHKEALYRAADHMEEPEVQEHIHNLIESEPQELEEAIEQDPDLKALRETNPLCAELMSDPTTMRILVDPDNLRALGDCPDLIEADFTNPDWSPPDVESVPFDEGATPANGAATSGPGGLVDADLDAEGDNVEGDVDNGEEGGEEEEEEEGFMDEYERGEEAQGANKGKQNKSKQKSNKKGSGQGGFISTVGTGLLDYVAAETVGMTATEMMGGDDDFGVEELEDEAEGAAEEAADAAEDNAEMYANAAAAAAELAENEDLVGNVEDTMDNVEEVHEDDKEQKSRSSAAGTAGAAVEGAAVGGLVGMNGVAGVKSADNEDKDEADENEDGKPRKSRLRKMGGAFGGGLAALSTAAKELALGAVLGDDLAEDLVEKMEEDSDDEDENSAGEEKRNKKDDSGDEPRRGSILRRKNA